MKKNIYLLLIITATTFLYFIFAILLNKWLNFGLSDSSIILVFIGITATFVVISNFSQVSKIENQVNSKLERISDLEKDIENLKAKNLYEKRVTSLENKLELLIPQKVRDMKEQTKKAKDQMQQPKVQEMKQQKEKLKNS
ncbi:MAG: hypothetical protein LBN95_06070 [Prevotellaceae bacterium]|jgi:hypothetical protein|nr:hypothetical protein [Prevotellaceae bacterium]